MFRAVKKEPQEFVQENKFDQVPGLTVAWESKLPAVTFTAKADAVPGTFDIEIRYIDHFIRPTNAANLLICTATQPRVKIE